MPIISGGGGSGGGGSGASDGWTADTNSPTFASATTFTAGSTDLTALYGKGTRIKLTQTTEKYFVVVASSFSAGTTTVTVTGGSDFTLANAAITSPFYSYQANPRGYPVTFNYDCAPTGIASVTQTLSKFAVFGNMCTCYYDVSGTSNNAVHHITLPVTPSSPGSVLAPMGFAEDNGVTKTTPGRFGTAAGATLSLLSDMGPTNWTASGATSFSGTFSYPF